MNIKDIPLAEPLITCYTPVAALFSILGKSPQTNDWILSNYINVTGYFYSFNGAAQLVLIPSWHATKFCPWIIESILSRDIYLSFNSSIVDYLVSCLNSNHYIFVVVDYSQIDCYDNKEYMPHDLFISGYDYDKKVFYIYDFVISRKFRRYEIPFSQIEQAFLCLKPEDDYINENFGGITLWKYNENAKYDLDLIHMKENLEEYLSQTNYMNNLRFMRNPQNDEYIKIKHGIGVYDFLKEVVIDHPYSIPKCMHNFYDHKALMVHRLKSLDDKGLLRNADMLIKAFTEIMNEIGKNCNLGIKYELTKDESLLQRIMSSLDRTKALEIDTVKSIVESIII